MSLAALSACQKAVQAPVTPGVCYAMEATDKTHVRFNILAKNQPDLEHCAAQLDMMRLRFMGLGMMRDRVVGAYQGQFLFARPQGIYTAQTLDGFQYLLLVHTGDGRLAKPGAMPGS